MAEFLVHRALPLSLVTEVAVRDSATQARVEQILDGVAVVIVRTDWYF